MLATHYHELTDLATTHERIQNYSIAVRERDNRIHFLHKLVQGAASRSYGIQVAALAGVPDQVVDPDELTPRQAQELLYELVEVMEQG